MSRDATRVRIQAIESVIATVVVHFQPMRKPTNRIEQHGFCACRRIGRSPDSEAHTEQTAIILPSYPQLSFGQSRPRPDLRAASRAPAANSGSLLPITIVCAQAKTSSSLRTMRRGDVGNTVQNKLAVGARQRRRCSRSVVDPQIVALADQAFNHLDHRALTQIIGSGFEAESKNPDARVAALHHLI